MALGEEAGRALVHKDGGGSEVARSSWGNKLRNRLPSKVLTRSFIASSVPIHEVPGEGTDESALGRTEADRYDSVSRVARHRDRLWRGSFGIVSGSRTRNRCQDNPRVGWTAASGIWTLRHDESSNVGSAQRGLPPIWCFQEPERAAG